LLEAERVETAEERLREALLLAREIEDRRGEALVALFLGVLLAETGKGEARSVIERSARLGEEGGLTRVESLARALLARLDLIAGDVTAAETEVRVARDLLDRFGAEFADRIVIAGTESLVRSRQGSRAEARAIARELGARVRAETSRLSSPLLRQRQGRAYSRLLSAAISTDGPLYPRVRLRGLPEEA
jgi:hypothetical protein